MDIQDIVDTLVPVFREKINLLIVDDEAAVLDAMVEMFSSPLITVMKATSASAATSLLNNGSYVWHCCVLDIAMEEEFSGLKLLEKNRNCPFVIMLSGMRSMTIASRAMQAGALKVFDKNPAALDLLHDEVCSIAALGFILGGKATKNLPVFNLLSQHLLSGPDQWAEKACITIRQLERICEVHSPLTPRYLLPLYYSIRILLLCDDDPADVLSRKPFLSDPQIRSHLEFVARNIDRVRDIQYRF